MSELRRLLEYALSDRYSIDRELGRGGMSVVFLARDRKHDRSVAIKALRPELAELIGSERFLREIEIAARLSHPHIVPLFDSGDIEGVLYYVMPYVEGESLRVRLDRTARLEIDVAFRIAREVAAALAYAHGRGVVHRDIKPENILLTGDEALVTDFGIARALSAARGQALTRSGIALGTLGYMSPEQAAGRQDLDARSDIYSLGCVFYEMLVGRRPSQWLDGRAATTGHIADAPAEDRHLLDSLPVDVERILAKALAPKAEQRFATAAELAEALRVRRLPGAPVGAKSIAVLAFTNMSADPDNEYLSDGIAEEITNALAKVQAMRVAARTSAFVFKGKGLDVRAIGRQLGVDTVLEGSVRRAGNRLRVSAQLVNVDDGCHLWSERYDRDMQDVFAIQDEIAQRIVQALKVVLSDEERRALAKVPTAHVQAYDHYLRGRQFLHQFKRQSLEFARQMFQRAIEIDPDYALAHAGIADCCSLLHQYWGSAPADLQGADAASRRALELDPDLAEAHSARGLALMIGGRHEEASAEFETATRLDPRQFEAHYYYARVCFQQGKHERAAELFERAAAIREDYQARFFAAQSLAALGRDEEALAAYRRALRAVEDHTELNPDDARAATMAAVASCRIGDKPQGIAWANRAITIEPNEPAIAYNVACLYALEGEIDRAFACLEQALSNGFGNVEWIRRDPDLAALRSDPRYERLLSRG